MPGRTLIRIGFLHAVFANEPWGAQANRSAWRPPTDLYETEQEVVVRVEIAGMRREDFVVTFDGGVLRIAGYRRDAGQKRVYHIMAIPFGYFSSDVDLGGRFRLVPDKMSAQYENGFLTVSMPKADARHTGGGE